VGDVAFEASAVGCTTFGHPELRQTKESKTTLRAAVLVLPVLEKSLAAFRSWAAPILDGFCGRAFAAPCVDR